MSETAQRAGVLGGGNFITDYVKVITGWPEQDTLATIQSESMSNGGGPYNVLKDLSKLVPGLRLEACGLVGDDLNGQWILEDCAAHGIDTGQLATTDRASTSYTDAMTVESDGRRTFFHQRGANALLAPGHFDFEQTNAKLFLLGYLMLLDTLDEWRGDGSTGAAEVLQAARKSGLIAAVDCVSTPHLHFREIALAAAQHADLFLVNEYEIGQILGQEVAPERGSMERAALELAEHAAGQVVLHAVSGAVVAERGRVLGAQGSVNFPESQIVGATGAGDAFAAGYLLGVHQDQPIDACLKFAVTSAAQSLTSGAPSEGMKSLATCLALLETHGERGF